MQAGENNAGAYGVEADVLLNIVHCHGAGKLDNAGLGGGVKPGGIARADLLLLVDYRAGHGGRKYDEAAVPVLLHYVLPPHGPTSSIPVGFMSTMRFHRSMSMSEPISVPSGNAGVAVGDVQRAGIFFSQLTHESVYRGGVADVSREGQVS